MPAWCSRSPSFRCASFGRLPAGNYIEALRVTLIEPLEPLITHLGELDEVAVGIVDGGAPEKSGVVRRVEHLDALFHETLDERLDVEHGERELDRADTMTAIWKGLNRMNREVQIAQ